MNVRANRYNDPNLGAAFEGLARVFAPPSAQDLAGYATANAKRQEAERLAWLFNNPNDPTASNRSSLIGVQGYGQTPDGYRYGVDTTAATARRGQDIGAATDLEKQRIAGQYGLAGQFMTPLAPGYVQPGLPDTVADAFGVPAMPRTEGAPKPLSEAEQKAAERQRLQSSGLLSDQMLADAIIGEQAPVKTVDPVTKLPVFSTPGTAARTGAQAYVDVGSAPKPENGMALLRDGTQVPAVQDPASGRWRHAQTGAELPPDIQVFKTPAPVGTNEQIGVGKPVANGIDRQLIDVAVAKDTAMKLRGMIATAPASQGAVGWLRGTAQNVVQMGGEVGQYFGGQIKDVTDAIASGAADASLAGAFDPSLPAIEMMANLLAFQYAKTTTGERLSNEMLRASRAALGLEGLTANQASSLARIDTAIKQMQAQEEILRRIRTNGVGAGQPAPATRLRFDANGNPIQ